MCEWSDKSEDRMRNKNVNENIGVNLEQIRKNRLRWFGYVIKRN